MGVPVIQHCCYCVSLQTGSIIIGYLYTIIAAFELSMYLLIITYRSLNLNEQIGRSALIIYAYYIMSSVVSLINLILGILLIFGATRKKATYLLPWSIFVGISAGIYFILGVMGMAIIIQSAAMTDEIVIVVIHFVRACVAIYCILVVHSLHKEIMNEKDQRVRYVQVQRHAI